MPSCNSDERERRASSWPVILKVDSHRRTYCAGEPVKTDRIKQLVA